MIPSALDCGTVRQSRFTTGNAFARMTAEHTTSTHPRKREPQTCNMADWTKCPAVESNPPKLGGAWVFTGMRVPSATLFENLKYGATVQEFVEWFPGSKCPSTGSPQPRDPIPIVQGEHLSVLSDHDTLVLSRVKHFCRSVKGRTGIGGLDQPTPWRESQLLLGGVLGDGRYGINGTGGQLQRRNLWRLFWIC